MGVLNRVNRDLLKRESAELCLSLQQEIVFNISLQLRISDQQTVLSEYDCELLSLPHISFLFLLLCYRFGIVFTNL